MSTQEVVATITAKFLDVLEYGARTSFRFAQWLDELRQYRFRGQCPKCGHILLELKHGVYRCQECHGK